ncbi:MAG: hypothetical protein HZB53_22510 [Chloroflexi bacterium]|nr:hypothetical protein [Chloroflexota bacterium]
MSDPLEQFLLDYVEAIGGLTDPIEPQVYAVLLPDSDTPRRVAFDPDALAEHPTAQLLTFGSTLLDEWLAQAHMRGRIAIAFLDDFNVRPHRLEQRLSRELTLPDSLSLQVQSVRPLYVSHAIFWFEATFISDEKEQALYSLALDRTYGRPVRHLDALLAGERLADLRRWAFPDAPARPLDECYRSAVQGVGRTLSAEINTRRHQLQHQVADQSERMRRYYTDLRDELGERIAKSVGSGAETESLRLRLSALDRERALRLDDLHRKTVLRVQLRLVNLLHVKAPRLFLACQLLPMAGRHIGAFRPRPLTLTWDPLVEKADALDCPSCNHPTLELRLNSAGVLGCPHCGPAPAKR